MGEESVEPRGEEETDAGIGKSQTQQSPRR